MPSSDRLVIEVGINEGRMRDDNPNVPFSPEEIAADAQRCYDAGAAVIHYHGRGPQGESMAEDSATNIETQRKIRERTPLVAYPTYGSQHEVLGGYYSIGGPANERYAHFIEGVESDAGFEIGPVDLGVALDVNAHAISKGGVGHSMESAAGDPPGWVLSTGLQMNTGEDHRWLTSFCQKNHLKMSFAAFDVGNLGNLKNIADMGWVREPPILVKFFFLGDLEGPRKLLYYVDLANDLLGHLRPSWTPVVYNANQFQMNTLAVSLGGHVRVGLGDYHYRELGAPTNAELVERMVAIGQAMGREPATPEEAREIQGINAAKKGRQ
jgi:3-keto-5-aminohexanoate cleavage enzyme